MIISTSFVRTCHVCLVCLQTSRACHAYASLQTCCASLACTFLHQKTLSCTYHRDDHNHRDGPRGDFPLQPPQLLPLQLSIPRLLLRGLDGEDQGNRREDKRQVEVDKQQVDSPAEGNPVEDTLAEGNHAVVDKLPAAEEDKLPVDTHGRDDYDVRRILCLVRGACLYPF